MHLPALPALVWPGLSRRYTVLFALLCLCCGLELILMAADAGLIGSRRWRMLALQNGAFWSGLLRDWQANYPYQPLAMFGTYSALHTGAMHLIGNMIALIWLGPTLIDRLGQGRFSLLWILSAFGGALCFALLSKTPVPMVGASGAIFGLFGALTALDYRTRGQLSAVFAMSAALAVLNIATLILERGSLAWETHLGGYLAGLLYVALHTPPDPVKV